MLRGEPIRQTRSTTPTSIPSSRDAVATHTLIVPAFSRCSASNRTSIDRLPWCAATFSSPIRSDSRWATRSASRRVFTNTSVVRCSFTSSVIWSRTCAHCSWVAIGPSSKPSGRTTARSMSRLWPVSTMAQPGSDASSPAPVRNRATVSIGFCVADSPMRVTGPSASRQRRSTDSARCEPRLLGTTACSSSRISVCTEARAWRPRSDVSRMNSDSGVVMSTCGGRLACSARSFADVSPVRTPTRISGSGVPRSSASAVISASGSSRLRLMSLASALSGET